MNKVIPSTKNVLNRSATQFRKYEAEHSIKASNPILSIVEAKKASDKALVNREFAEMLEASLQHLNDTDAPEFDYVAETEVTASDTYAPENVDAEDFARLINQFCDLGEKLNRYKKVLFRKQTCEEAGIKPVKHITLEHFLPQHDADLVHGIVGMLTETCELAEILRDIIVYNKSIDKFNLREEIGDNLWYMARIVKYANTTFEAEMQRNIAKLRARHGAGFSKERDMNRDLDAERKILESNNLAVAPGINERNDRVLNTYGVGERQPPKKLGDDG